MTAAALNRLDPLRPRTDRSRSGRVRSLVAELEEQAGNATRGRCNALAVLLVDAALSRDEDALIAGQRGLQPSPDSPPGSSRESSGSIPPSSSRWRTS